MSITPRWKQDLSQAIGQEHADKLKLKPSSWKFDLLIRLGTIRLQAVNGSLELVDIAITYLLKVENRTAPQNINYWTNKVVVGLELGTVSDIGHLASILPSYMIMNIDMKLVRAAASYKRSKATPPIVKSTSTRCSTGELSRRALVRTSNPGATPHSSADIR